ncbi:hypothetical protein PAEVO_63060 [Paenibacillus sp. GM2FR]|nr:hypothetical protein PAEVO_63060 [Paenibacillus sp. GM2FR]
MCDVFLHIHTTTLRSVNVLKNIVGSRFIGLMSMVYGYINIMSFVDLANFFAWKMQIFMHFYCMMLGRRYVL